MKKPDAILFDWDNTLADTWPTIHASMTKTFEEMGKTPWTMEETKQNVHRSLRDSFPELFGEHWERAGEIYLNHFKEIHLAKLTPIENAEEVLKILKGSDIYVALVSNKTGENLRAEVEHMGWDHYFAKVVGAKDAEADKPHPAPVHMALEGSGIIPGEHVWFVGDSVTDLECAKNTGCTPIFYGEQNLREERFEGHDPVHHFKDHAELLQAIKILTTR